MTQTVKDVIGTLLDTIDPASLTLVGPDARSAIADWLEVHDAVDVREFQGVAELMAEPAFTSDWVLAVGCLESLDDQSGAEFIGRLRNVVAQRFCLLVDDDNKVWTANRLTGFGIERLTAEPLALGTTKTVRAYRYDLATYKQTPDWLNSDYWANPDRFNKDFW